MTLYELMVEDYIYQCKKHGLAEDSDEYARQELNTLTNAELIYALSEALKRLGQLK